MLRKLGIVIMVVILLLRMGFSIEIFGTKGTAMGVEDLNLGWKSAVSSMIVA